jgi:hypothetical protein
MTLKDPTVFSTVNGDGSAEFTISVDDEDHKFSASPKGDSTALVSYEETLSWRGLIRVKEPREEVFKLLVQSDEMTHYLERFGLTRVRRDR